MFGRLDALMQWRADLLMAGRLEDLAREYLYPLVLYLDERQLVLRDAEALSEVLARLRAAQQAQGVRLLQSQVTAVDLPRHGRFRVWVRYRSLGASGRPIMTSDAILYCRDMPDGVKSEMVEYGDCMMSDLWDGVSALQA